MRATGVPLALPLLLAAAPLSSTAQPSTNANPSSSAARALNALSADDVAALRDGHGMGLEKPAELNRHPGPGHVLDLADKLDLTPAQRRDTQAIYDRMHTHAIALGARIVAQEHALEALFADNAPTAATRVRQVITDIARLNGMLRFVPLGAHIATARALTPAQIDAYDRLRGYVHYRPRGAFVKPDAKPAPTPTPAHTHGAHTH